jgi:Mrp family chromosome partitioning ATPase
MGAGNGAPSLVLAWRVAWRGKWLILLATVLVTTAATYLSQRQEPLYRASSTILLKYQSLASVLSGLQESGTSQQPERAAKTQTKIAMSPAVADRVVKRTRIPGLTTSAFLERASVVASPDADVLEFSVTYPDPVTAVTLANLHGRAYIKYRQELDTASLVAARKELRIRIDELSHTVLRRSRLLTNLIVSEQQLRTLAALQTSNASLLRAAEIAVQVQPKPKRAGALGVVLGLLLGIGLAFARDALDTRVRTAADVASELGIPMLGRLPAPPKDIRGANRLATLSEPNGFQAEAFRMVRTNLDFVNLDHGARSILVTSAREREGKTTTAANLAVVLARGGRRVALVDLDLRRSGIHRYFGVERTHPGVTSVVSGRATLDQALIDIPLGGLDPFTGDVPGHVLNGVSSELKVLIAGLAPPNPGEFISSREMGRLLVDLAERFDVVLIDTPPLLSVGDAMSLSPSVDGMVVVTRLHLLRQPMLEELGRALGATPTVKLGFILTGAEEERPYRHSADPYYPSRPDYWVRTPDAGVPNV